MKILHEVSKKHLKTVEILGIGCFEGDKDFLKKSCCLDAHTKDAIQKILASKKISFKCGETFFTPAPFMKSAGTLFFIGLGKREQFCLGRVRKASAKFLSQAKAFKYKTARLDLDSFSEKFSLAEIASAALEGARLSDYSFDKYKSKPAPSAGVEELSLVSGYAAGAKAARTSLAETELVMEGVSFARNLANEPANVMTPSRLAKAAREMAAKHHLTCRVLGRTQMKRLGMGGVLAVSQGSGEEPQFIVLENRVKQPRFSNPIVLVGKGITFDTGGISIKPANDMDKMKFDMCGAAAVIGTMKVIADLKWPVRVVGLAPVCENMPGGRAQRPGDIITISNGKTVEVLNTDAEGRLVLADALSYAAKYKPKILVDIATLTGACAATFADLAIGLMGTDPELVERIRKAGEQTGERCWELPLWHEYFDLIKATYADLQNISKKYAGTITAGMFLKEFADHTKAWAHLDIAGTAWNEGGPKPLSPIGATGVGVRLFVELIKDYLKN